MLFFRNLGIWELGGWTFSWNLPYPQQSSSAFGHLGIILAVSWQYLGSILAVSWQYLGSILASLEDFFQIKSRFKDKFQSGMFTKFQTCWRCPLKCPIHIRKTEDVRWQDNNHNCSFVPILYHHHSSYDWKSSIKMHPKTLHIAWNALPLALSMGLPTQLPWSCSNSLYW